MLQDDRDYEKVFTRRNSVRWESAETSRRSRRILEPEMVGMHVDSNGALVDEREEYGTSSSASSHSFEDVNSDGVQENISDFE